MDYSVLSEWLEWCIEAFAIASVTMVGAKAYEMLSRWLSVCCLYPCG